MTLAQRRSYNMLNGTRGAVMSEDGTYRYMLVRWLQGHGPAMVFLMLNPSTADANADDPTIRRCIGFANREGARSLVVINLFAFRSTKPDLMFSVPEYNVGPENDNYIRRIAQLTPGKRIVCAWGADKRAELRAIHVRRILQEAGAEVLCLGVTAKGMPRHPLYVPAGQPLVPYRG